MKKTLSLLLWLARLGCLGIPIYMLISCPACEGSRASYGITGLYVLPVLGIVYGAFLLLTANKREEKDWYYGGVTLATFGMLALVFARAYAGGTVCSWCLAFWACHLVLLAEFLLFSRQLRILKLAWTGIVLGLAGFCMVGFMPTSKMWVDDTLAGFNMGITPYYDGPPIGSTVPDTPTTPRDCSVVFWTDCPICLRVHLGEITKKIRKDPVYVFAIKDDPDILAYFPNAKVFIGQENFLNWQVTHDGPPIFLTIRNDQVISKSSR